MKLEEVLAALRAGKTVLNEGLGLRIRDWSGLSSLMAHQLSDCGWSIVEEPATDEELAAAFEKMADRIRRGQVVEEHDVASALTFAAGNLQVAADMVRKRYVDPSWKVVK